MAAVPSLPPNSHGLNPAAKARSTACSIVRAARAAPSCPWRSASQSSIITAERIVAMGFATPLPVMSGAVRGTAGTRVPIAGRRRRHPHSADQSGGEIRDNVAEHVFHHQEIELPGLAHQHGRARINIKSVRAHGGKAHRAFVEHLAKERVRLECVRLVDAGQEPSSATRLAPLRQAEGEIEQTLASLAGDHKRLTGLGVGHYALAHRGKQALGQLPG